MTSYCQVIFLIAQISKNYSVLYIVNMILFRLTKNQLCHYCLLLQNSNDLSMKLKAVEGQLKVVKEKLAQSQESYSELLEKEKKQWESEVTLMKEQHAKEVNSLKEQITALTNQLKKNAQQVQTQISLPSPEIPRKKGKKPVKYERRPTEIPSNLAAHLNLPNENRLSRSVDNLANWANEDDERKAMQSKVTITELVEQSLRKPESIAAIRKELKEAN